MQAKAIKCGPIKNHQMHSMKKELTTVPSSFSIEIKQVVNNAIKVINGNGKNEWIGWLELK